MFVRYGTSSSFAAGYQPLFLSRFSEPILHFNHAIRGLFFIGHIGTIGLESFLPLFSLKDGFCSGKNFRMVYGITQVFYPKKAVHRSVSARHEAIWDYMIVYQAARLLRPRNDDHSLTPPNGRSALSVYAPHFRYFRKSKSFNCFFKFMRDKI